MLVLSGFSVCLVHIDSFNGQSLQQGDSAGPIYTKPRSTGLLITTGKDALGVILSLLVLERMEMHILGRSTQALIPVRCKDSARTTLTSA
jgi:hypothetical protein